MVSKEVSIKSHAKARFKERVGVELTRELSRAIIKQIQSGKMQCLKRQSRRVTVWKYTVGEQDYKLFYDNKRHLIITIYPIRSYFREWLYGSIELVRRRDEQG